MKNNHEYSMGHATKGQSKGSNNASGYASPKKLGNGMPKPTPDMKTPTYGPGSANHGMCKGNAGKGKNGGY